VDGLGNRSPSWPGKSSQPRNATLQSKFHLLSASARILGRNKRYILWFYLLNLAFALAGGIPFSTNTHRILDHSLYADRLLHGFDLAVLEELIARPQFGPVRSSALPALIFALLFFLASMVFMPGVLLSYSSDHSISHAEFFRACGQNVWRFVRLCAVFAFIAGILTANLAGIPGAVENALDKYWNDDRLPLLLEGVMLALVFVLLTALRIWFDLGETDVVLRDQSAVRKSIRWALRATRQHFFHLLGSYLVAAIAASVILLAGIFSWHVLVPPSSVRGAFWVSQATLLLLLVSRFWQRAIAVAFYLRISTQPETELRLIPIRLPATRAP
jgi:hypothetical protein